MKGVPRIRLAILNARASAKKVREECARIPSPRASRTLLPVAESLESLADATEEMLDLVIQLSRR
jgi:hypothetical protein